MDDSFVPKQLLLSEAVNGRRWGGRCHEPSIISVSSFQFPGTSVRGLQAPSLEFFFPQGNSKSLSFKPAALV